MPALNDPKVYQRGLPLTVRKPFRFNGRDFSTGDSFHARRMVVTHRKVQSLINANFLTQKYSEDKVPPVTKEEMTVKHHGGGWYDVFQGKTKLTAKKVRKAEAEKISGLTIENGNGNGKSGRRKKSGRKK